VVLITIWLANRRLIMTTLYKKDSKGKIRQWNIEVAYGKHSCGIQTADGLHGGKIKDPIFKEAIPNNLFKTSELKAEAMMKSAIDKKLRSNYFRSIEEIKDEDILFMPTGCPSGMIWKEWKDKAHVVYPALASPKLDGSKVYSTKREGRVFLNTRSAKEHKNFRHIELELKKFYKARPNIVLDGEAYNHHYRDRFEELQSIFRKESPTDVQRAQSEAVARFYVYDAVDLHELDMDAEHRQFLLKEVIEEIDSPYIVWWPSVLVDSEEAYDEYHELCMDKGFEGTVLKICDAPYVQRKNKNVMKRKPKFDCEFRITNVFEGTGTAKGIAARVEIELLSVVGMNKGHEEMLDLAQHQDAGMAKGWNHKMLAEMLSNKADYIGKMGTIEYGGMTAYGKLRFPKFKALRTD
jgi:ATP-dependent DNA ligase